MKQYGALFITNLCIGSAFRLFYFYTWSITLLSNPNPGVTLELRYVREIQYIQYILLVYTVELKLYLDKISPYYSEIHHC